MLVLVPCGSLLVLVPCGSQLVLVPALRFEVLKFEVLVPCGSHAQRRACSVVGLAASPSAGLARKLAQTSVTLKAAPFLASASVDLQFVVFFRMGGFASVCVWRGGESEVLKFRSFEVLRF